MGRGRGFRDYCRPTSSELRAWAFEPEADEPIQDWELFLVHAFGDEAFAREVFELASDPTCPKRDYLLNLLYFVFQRLADSDRPGVGSYAESILRHAQSSHDPDIKRLRYRARLLLQRPETYDSESWYRDRRTADEA